MNWNVIIPLILFTIIIFAIGFWSSRKLSSSNSFLSDYFLGGRELGGLVLAMTMVATYGSASSFLGGPGAAYSIGLGWVRSEEHTSELQSRGHLVCRLLLEKKKNRNLIR